MEEEGFGENVNINETGEIDSGEIVMWGVWGGKERSFSFMRVRRRVIRVHDAPQLMLHMPISILTTTDT